MHLFLMALAVIRLFRIAARQQRRLHPRPRRPFNWRLALFLAGLLGAIMGLAQVSQWLSAAPSKRASPKKRAPSRFAAPSLFRQSGLRPTRRPAAPASDDRFAITGRDIGDDA